MSISSQYSENAQSSEEESEEEEEARTNADDCDNNVLEDDLGYINMSISSQASEGFQLWADHDEAIDNFCILDDHQPGSEYVDLSLNPERYTGYSGESAHRVWRSIYLENCFG